MVNPRKVEWVEELEDEIEESANLIFTGFRGLTVEKMENLRRQLYDCDTTYRVVKNRLARRAFLQENAGEETSDESSATERKEEASEAELTDLPGVGPATAEDFQAAGFNSVVDVASSAEEELQQIQGVGPSRAGEMLEEAKKISGPRKDSEEQKSSNGEVPEEINEFLSGNTAIAFNRKGIVEAAKVMVEFAEESETFEIKGGLLEDRLLHAEEVQQLSELSSRRELLTELAMDLNSPIQKLARYLKDPLQKLVQVMNRVKENKEDSKE